MAGSLKEALQDSNVQARRNELSTAGQRQGSRRDGGSGANCVGAHRIAVISTWVLVS
jgi:hypothetical protein